MIIKLTAATNTKGMFISATPGGDALTKEEIVANACALVYGIMTTLGPGINTAVIDLFLKHRMLLELAPDSEKDKINNGMAQAMREIAGSLIELGENERTSES
jgi:hypothetical protein